MTTEEKLLQLHKLYARTIKKWIYEELLLTDVLKALSDKKINANIPENWYFAVVNDKWEYYSFIYDNSKPYLKDQDTEVIDTIFNLLTN